MKHTIRDFHDKYEKHTLAPKLYRFSQESIEELVDTLYNLMSIKQPISNPFLAYCFMSYYFVTDLPSLVSEFLHHHSLEFTESQFSTIIYFYELIMRHESDTYLFDIFAIHFEKIQHKNRIALIMFAIHLLKTLIIED